MATISGRPWLPGSQYYALRSGCRLMAEGVETDEEANVLMELGVDLAQGYLFGRPERTAGLRLPVPVSPVRRSVQASSPDPSRAGGAR